MAKGAINFFDSYTSRVGGWLEKIKIEQSSASAGLKLAEIGNKGHLTYL